MARHNRTTVWVIVGSALCFLMLVGLASVGMVAYYFYRKPAPPPTVAFIPPERPGDRAEAAAVFGDPLPPDPDQVREFTRFFNDFHADAVAPNGDPARYFDCDRMFVQFEQSGALKGLGVLSEKDKQSFKSGMQRAIPTSTKAQFALLGLKSVVVRRVRKSSGSEVVVVATHVCEDGVIVKMRWWLNKSPRGWAIYDSEDLNLGVPFSHLCGYVGAAVGKDFAKIQQFAKICNIAPAIKAANEGKIEEARRLLDECRGISFPGPLEDLHELGEAVYDFATERYADAEERMTRVIRRNPDMPVAYTLRSAALNRQMKWEASAADCEKYIAMLGPDEAVCTTLGFDREALDQKPKAVEAFRQALDAKPDAIDALDGLRRNLPAGKKGEAAARLLKCPKPIDLYKDLVQATYADGDNEAALAYAEAMHQAHPKFPAAANDLIRQRVRDAKFEDAERLMRSAAADVAEDDRKSVYDAYMWAMALANRHLQAYEQLPNPVATFEQLGSDLDADLYEVFDPEQPYVLYGYERAQVLVELTRKHAVKHPDDPWLAYFQGRELMRNQQYEAADKKFTEALRNQKIVDPHATDTFRRARVLAQFRLGRSLDALRTIPPAADTFDQLANLHQFDSDWAGLAELVKAFRKADPGDRSAEYWLGLLAWEKKDYPAAVRSLRKYAAAQTKEDYLYSWSVNDLIARGLIRTDRGDEALKFLQGLKHRPRAVHAATLAAAGHHADAVELMSDSAKEFPWQAETFYADEDLSPFLKRPEYKEFCEKFPRKKLTDPAFDQ